MQIVDNKILVVRTRRPHLVTDKIKKSKVVKELGDGLHDVAVFWGLDEAQELAKLRIKNVPSTITRDYDWPYHLPTVDHEVRMAERPVPFRSTP
jgi:hypothetical protein